MLTQTLELGIGNWLYDAKRDQAAWRTRCTGVGYYQEATTMAENGIPWRRDAEKALDEAKENKKRALVDFTAAPM
jgi:hypothetical protein